MLDANDVADVFLALPLLQELQEIFSLLQNCWYWSGNLTTHLSCSIFSLALYLGSANLRCMLKTPPSLHPG